MASAQLKLLAALPKDWQPEARRMAARFHVDLAGWYRRANPASLLRAVADAVWGDRRISIEYDSWRGVVTRELEPLGLVVKASEWYLVARPPGRTTARTYKVDQIRALTAGVAFTRPVFDLATYWRRSTERFEREIYRGTATVRLNRRGRQLLSAASAALSDAIARSTGAPDAWWTVELPTETIEHATEQMLGLGPNVEVLAPAVLRDRVRDGARAIAALYTRRAKR
jgi:predicted DNA-binding transcriptional regulator YafY